MYIELNWFITSLSLLKEECLSHCCMPCWLTHLAEEAMFHRESSLCLTSPLKHLHSIKQGSGSIHCHTQSLLLLQGVLPTALILQIWRLPKPVLEHSGFPFFKCLFSGDEKPPAMQINAWKKITERLIGSVPGHYHDFMQQLVILQLSWRRCSLQPRQAFHNCNRNNEPCSWKTKGINHLSFRMDLSPPQKHTQKVSISKQVYREYFSFLLKSKCQSVLSGLLQAPK